MNHYKVCSTFDSSPRIGSIGRAMEIGAKVFSSEWVPVVAAAPQLGRYVLFSNLFAEARGKVYRIDRHPTMQRHPVTPMDEADLRVHLARQTSIPLDYVDASAFSSGCAAQKLRSGLAAGARAIVFDGLDSSMLQETASLIWKSATNHPIFAVGSSGLTHGLLHHWHRLGCIGDPPVLEAAVPADRLLVLSGSCSPVTAQQIHTARRQGFADFHVNGTSSWTAETDEAVRSLARGESVVLYTALGIADQPESFRHDRNRALGEMMREILLHSGVRRIVIAGGDTASHAISQLGLNALTFAAPLAPGAPLCRAHAPGSTLDGLELVLKGGQIGPDNFFAMVRDGA